jgi:glycosyltransferase involved in cell wall biosynthesis
MSEKQTKKLIFVINSFEVGGTEKHLLGLLPRLAKFFTVEVFLFKTAQILEISQKNENFFQFQNSGIASQKIGRVWATIRLFFFLRRNKSAYVHFFLPEPYIFGGICSILLRIPNLIMSRRSLNLYQKNYMFVDKIEKFLHKKMQLIIANSESVMQDLVAENVEKDKIKIIYNPVEKVPLVSADTRIEKRKELGLHPDSLIFIFVANLFPYKGHMDLLDSLARISYKLPHNWNLILVGRDDGYEKELKGHSKKLNLSKHIIFTGEKQNVYEYLSASDIGIHPSHQEGFSNSVLEGMAVGLPMIVTNVGGNCEAVQHEVNGLLVEARDIQKLGDAISLLASDKNLRQKYGLSARLRAQTEFTWEVCIEKYKRIYSNDLK